MGLLDDIITRLFGSSAPEDNRPWYEDAWRAPGATSYPQRYYETDVWDPSNYEDYGRPKKQGYGQYFANVGKPPINDAVAYGLDRARFWPYSLPPNPQGDNNVTPVLDWLRGAQDENPYNEPGNSFWWDRSERSL